MKEPLQVLPLILSPFPEHLKVSLILTTFIWKDGNQPYNNIKIIIIEVKSLSRVRLFATPWTVAYQASQFMGFSRQEYWSGLPFPSPGDLPDPGIEPRSLALQADALPSEPPGKLAMYIVLSVWLVLSQLVLTITQ